MSYLVSGHVLLRLQVCGEEAALTSLTKNFLPYSIQPKNYLNCRSLERELFSYPSAQGTDTLGRHNDSIKPLGLIHDSSRKCVASFRLDSFSFEDLEP